MQTQYSTLSFSGFTLHRIDFDPSTFDDADLLWLPHHAQLARAGRKRKAEHLAGRIAAVNALGQYGEKGVPAIGGRGQPLWPVGLNGSITHCETCALAVVSRQPVGVDMETLFTPELANEVAGEIISAQERQVLPGSALPFPLALTVAFSAKESLYKAFSWLAKPWPEFTSARVSAFDQQHITLTFQADFCPQLAGKSLTMPWMQVQQRVITLAFQTTGDS